MQHRKGHYVRRNYELQTWDEGISCGHHPDTGEVLKGMTDQSFKDECDINRIIDHALRTGEWPEPSKVSPIYGDFSSVEDFQGAMDIIAKGKEQFEALDAHIRKRFNNSPLDFLAFVADPANGEEMVKMKLAEKTPEQVGREKAAANEQKEAATALKEKRAADALKKKAAGPQEA